MNTAPARLHHTAWVARDLEATRHFYEDLLGLPLVATWTEIDEGGAEFAHAFFGLAEGGALAFFQFADAEKYEQFKPQLGYNPYVHVALKVSAEQQAAIASALDGAGLDNLTINHGFCESLYANDPDGMLVELTCDRPDIDAIDAERLKTAHDDLRRWLSGDHANNNVYR